MSHADSEFWSYVDNFPPPHPVVKNVSIWNLITILKVLTYEMGDPQVSTKSALKKQADDFLIKFCSNLAELNDKLIVFSKSMLELLETVPNL